MIRERERERERESERSWNVDRCPYVLEEEENGRVPGFVKGVHSASLSTM